MALSPPLAQKGAQQGEGYRLPSAALQAVVDAPRAPSLYLSPKRDLTALLQTPALPSIAQVAAPELKLAGLRINPKTVSDSRFSFGSKLWLASTSDGKERQISGLPQPLSVASLAWSPDQKYLAFNQLNPATGSNELWLVDVETASARRVAERLNSIVGNGYSWLPGSDALLVMQRPAGQGEPPHGDGVPTGPAVQQTEAGQGVRTVRTYQDLLKNEDDARLFEYYMQAQPVRVSISGDSKPVGAAGIYLGLSASPDGKYLLSQRVQRPFSYAVPVSRFPRHIEVLDAQGKLVHTVARLPLVDGLPTGNDAVPTGVR
ncbi:MAG: S9 family peptidase, partial [Stenotrophomonas sp.]